MEWHRHHIVPKHAGGTDDPTNILKCNRPMHIMLHWIRWLEEGSHHDYNASRLLMGKPAKPFLGHKQSDHQKEVASRTHKGTKKPHVKQPPYDYEKQYGEKWKESQSKAKKVKAIFCIKCRKGFNKGNFAIHLKAKGFRQYKGCWNDTIHLKEE